MKWNHRYIFSFLLLSLVFGDSAYACIEGCNLKVERVQIDRGTGYVRLWFYHAFSTHTMVIRDDSPDTDKDGVPDEAEKALKTDPNNACDYSSDYPGASSASCDPDPQIDPDDDPDDPDNGDDPDDPTDPTDPGGDSGGTGGGDGGGDDTGGGGGDGDMGGGGDGNGDGVGGDGDGGDPGEGDNSGDGTEPAVEPNPDIEPPPIDGDPLEPDNNIFVKIWYALLELTSSNKSAQAKAQKELEELNMKVNVLSEKEYAEKYPELYEEEMRIQKEIAEQNKKAAEDAAEMKRLMEEAARLQEERAKDNAKFDAEMAKRDQEILEATLAMMDKAIAGNATSEELLTTLQEHVARNPENLAAYKETIESLKAEVAAQGGSQVATLKEIKNINSGIESAVADNTLKIESSVDRNTSKTVDGLNQVVSGLNKVVSSIQNKDLTVTVASPVVNVNVDTNGLAANQNSNRAEMLERLKTHQESLAKRAEEQRKALSEITEGQRKELAGRAAKQEKELADRALAQEKELADRAAQQERELVLLQSNKIDEVVKGVGTVAQETTLKQISETLKSIDGKAGSGSSVAVNISNDGVESKLSQVNETLDKMLAAIDKAGGGDGTGDGSSGAGGEGEEEGGSPWSAPDVGWEKPGKSDELAFALDGGTVEADLTSTLNDMGLSLDRLSNFSPKRFTVSYRLPVGGTWNNLRWEQRTFELDNPAPEAGSFFSDIKTFMHRIASAAVSLLFVTRTWRLIGGV